MAWSRFYRRDFEWQVSPLSLAGPLLRQRGAGGFAPLYQAFVDQRHGMRERFRQYHHNLVAAETWLAGAKDALTKVFAGVVFAVAAFILWQSMPRG